MSLPTGQAGLPKGEETFFAPKAESFNVFYEKSDRKFVLNCSNKAAISAFLPICITLSISEAGRSFSMISANLFKSFLIESGTAIRSAGAKRSISLKISYLCLTTSLVWIFTPSSFNLLFSRYALAFRQTSASFVA